MSDSLLKNLVHSDVRNVDRALLLLGAIGRTSSVADIRLLAVKSGIRSAARWNISSDLARAGSLAIKVPDGWELTEAGRAHVHALGFPLASEPPAAVKAAFRVHLERVSDPETRTFLLEAVRCFEHHLYRSAVVMSWMAAVHVLHKYVVKNFLAEFNAEASRVDAKWRPAKTPDDLGRMGEAEFLDRISAISIIGKNVKEELQKALKLRNGCGHPNSLKVRENAVANHIEILMLNVFEPFS